MTKPIDMVLHCPKCGTQHIDAEEIPEPHMMGRRWTNPPHRSHLCHTCFHIWRPADVPTNGVAAVETRGRRDSPPTLSRSSYEAAYKEWSDKTDWIRPTLQPHELGKHLADVMRERLERVDEDAKRYRALRDDTNQLQENDICVSDDSFNTYFGEDLDREVDALIERANR